MLYKSGHFPFSQRKIIFNPKKKFGVIFLHKPYFLAEDWERYKNNNKIEQNSKVEEKKIKQIIFAYNNFKQISEQARENNYS